MLNSELQHQKEKKRARGGGEEKEIIEIVWVIKKKGLESKDEY